MRVLPAERGQKRIAVRWAGKPAARTLLGRKIVAVVFTGGRQEKEMHLTGCCQVEKNFHLGGGERGDAENRNALRHSIGFPGALSLTAVGGCFLDVLQCCREVHCVIAV